MQSAFHYIQSENKNLFAKVFLTGACEQFGVTVRKQVILLLELSADSGRILSRFRLFPG